MELKTISQEELAEIIRKHRLWIKGEEGGERANLYRANLKGANLYRANLYRANLDGANLDGANLDGANLYRANLDGANLDGANLDGANLDGANLYRANLDGAKGKILSIGPIGSRNGITYAYWSDKDKTIHIKCGCFYGIFDEWVNKCAETHGDSVHGKAYAAAAVFITAFAEIHNWAGVE